MTITQDQINALAEIAYQRLVQKGVVYNTGMVNRQTVLDAIAFELITYGTAIYEPIIANLRAEVADKQQVIEDAHFKILALEGFKNPAPEIEPAPNEAYNIGAL